ncbi:MAG: EscU/YscU/HrcU family type III secretion system export apparatus switch protein [Marivibrio sp.]|uniref:EscU/YscU/HrcU family type III secretion system export apparatus switch protein n=1 Tax=Marivibrio sp. TaxID=2039719 RepID=UPI0032EDA321
MVERSKLGKSDRPKATPAAAQGDAPGAADPNRKAVALAYKPDTADSAPVVSASGRGALAERIVEAAREAGVPIQEDPDLVELLAATEVGEEIPVEAFIAVAEILRYVYQANGRTAPQPSRAGRDAAVSTDSPSSSERTDVPDGTV